MHEAFTCLRAPRLLGRKLELGPDDVFLQKAPVSFDASVQELFNLLACGGVLLLAAPGGEKDTQYLARLCKEQRVTCASFVPSQLDVLLQACLMHNDAASASGLRTLQYFVHAVSNNVPAVCAGA